jgi:hypothetical protein
MHKEHCKIAKDLNSRYLNTPDDNIGPIVSALTSIGPAAGKRKSTVLGLGIGCFGELSAGIGNVCTFVAL